MAATFLETVVEEMAAFSLGMEVMEDIGQETMVEMADTIQVTTVEMGDSFLATMVEMEDSFQAIMVEMADTIQETMEAMVDTGLQVPHLKNLRNSSRRSYGELSCYSITSVVNIKCLFERHVMLCDILF